MQRRKEWDKKKQEELKWTKWEKEKKIDSFK